ncbi:M48 family metallopeptidase [Algoriphagus sp. AK58]|uniref:tetratricopeptide repeat protein n=1 Tax=Algoriphagus sp. AK58 TaxID=1406877 RepID=UPI00164F5E50|nr:hypothetical protein [Algoriphagus sp. AK58]MBC6365303.1 hypothetical protein [Algoriphagus sp. AK58]
MQQVKARNIGLAQILALLLLVSGGLFAIISLILSPWAFPNIQPAAFLDTVAVPFNSVEIGDLKIPIKLDNYLVFQDFHSLPARITLWESYLFGGVVLLSSVSALALVSQFKKFPFLGAGVAWILLLTLSNVNGLNIGGPSANVPLIILLAGTVLPTVFFHIWAPKGKFWIKWIILFFSVSATLFVLIRLSTIPNPALYLSEQSLIIGLGLGVSWIFWQGHGMLSGVFVLLSKANENLSTKVSVQVFLLALVYFFTMIFLLLDLRGEVNLPFPTFSPIYLLFPLGIFSWFSIQEKINQSSDLAGSENTLKALFILGFAMILWTVWKLEVSANQPAEELVKHLLVYSQIGFSLFFFIYLMSNFLGVMNSGKGAHRIMYKPYSLPYYHLRIGGIISMLVITIYMEAIVAAQANSLTNNILGDYYYQTDQKLEASILYENSWDRYRYNPKAKNLTAHLLFQLNQPTLAKEHLEQSFAEAPQVDNILLVSERLQRENKLFEAVYYLENGLKRFPGNPYLVNNLALFYTLSQRYEEAALLLKESSNVSEITASNWTALQSKLGLVSETSELGNDLISQINNLAAKRKKGEQPEESELESLRNQLEKEKSPMLIHAGYRNLVTEINTEDPSEEIRILDSLAKEESFLDFTMQLQETAILRSLGAGRINEAVKNLNGLAFRNPGDAAYYLNLTGLIQAQQLDFQKASKDFMVADEKGFKAIEPHHLAIFELGGFTEKAAELALKFPEKATLEVSEELALFGNFNQQLPDKLFETWKSISNPAYQVAFGLKLLSHKAHGLTKIQLSEIGKSLEGKVNAENELQTFLQNPDWTDANSLGAFTRFLGLNDELTANPYFTPLVLSAADRAGDPLLAYEIINSASDFNQDPLLWIRKVQAAKRIGLDNYATAAIQEMSKWMTWDEIEKLQMANY